MQAGLRRNDEVAKIIFLQESRFCVAVARGIIQDAPVALAVIPAQAGIQWFRKSMPAERA